MDLLANLALGFETALTLQNLGYAFMGALFGTLVGVLPGLGPAASIAMLLPQNRRKAGWLAAQSARSGNSSSGVCQFSSSARRKITQRASGGVTTAPSLSKPMCMVLRMACSDGALWW